MPHVNDRFEDKNSILNTINKIMKTVAASYYSISKEDMENIYGVENIDALVEKYGLTLDDEYAFGSCPVFIGEKDENIHVCGLCCAIMVLYNGLREKLNDAEYVTLKSQLNAMLNTLIVLSRQNYEKDFAFWPTTVTKTREAESGTFNQTTMALSTLSVCGFLTKDIDTISTDQLKARSELIIDSLHWIIHHQYTDGLSGGAWSYGEHCNNTKGQKVNTAILPSFFCYETLQKYHSLFTSSAVKLNIIYDLDKDILIKIEEACTRFETWVQSSLNDDDGIEKRSDEQESSFIHTCLATVIYNYGKENLDITTLRRMVRYLCTHKKKLDFSDDEIKETYNFDYTCTSGAHGYKQDTYEICVCPVLINNISKLLDSPYNVYISNKQKKKLRELNYKLKEKLNRTCSTIQLNNNGPYFVIRGVLGEQKAYPIYGLYNTQICLLRVYENEKRNPYQKIKLFKKPMFRIGPSAIGWLFAGILMLIYFLCAILYFESKWLSILGFVFPLLIGQIEKFVEKIKTKTN